MNTNLLTKPTIAEMLEVYILSDVLYNRLTDKYIKGLYFAEENKILDVIFKDSIDTCYLVSSRYLFKQLEHYGARYINHKWIIVKKDTQLSLPVSITE